MRSARVDGHAIQRARELAGLTQQALADKLQVDRSSVGHWESGRKSPKGENFRALCKVLKQPREYFLAVPDAQAA